MRSLWRIAKAIGSDGVSASSTTSALRKSPVINIPVEGIFQLQWNSCHDFAPQRSALPTSPRGLNVTVSCDILQRKGMCGMCVLPRRGKP
jgi:hypothetical protein